MFGEGLMRPKGSVGVVGRGITNEAVDLAHHCHFLCNFRIRFFVLHDPNG